VRIGVFAIYSLNTISTCAASIMYSLLASNVVDGIYEAVLGQQHVLHQLSHGQNSLIQTFVQEETPRYQTGIAVPLASFCANIVLFASLYVIYTISHRRRDKDVTGNPPLDEAERMRLAFSDLTDPENQTMRYAL
jgi:hypothetical protein